MVSRPRPVRRHLALAGSALAIDGYQVSKSKIAGCRIAGISTCVPPGIEQNQDPSLGFDPGEVRKVVAMAGVKERRIAAPGVTSADLCEQAARQLLEQLDWDPASIDALLFVTQTPDHFLPSSSCLLQHRLGLGDHCAAFDVGLGCSGYPYGLQLCAAMLRAGGHSRILLLHGETPSRIVAPDDHATRLLFSDCGSATALERDDSAPESAFCLHSDGSGGDSLMLRGGGFRDREPVDARDRYLRMDGAAVFNFTIKRVPALIADTLELAGASVGDVDAFVFHQSNRFIMKHLAKKCGIAEARMPLSLELYGNAGGPSVPLTVTTQMRNPQEGTERWMMIGYGVGLSWASALVTVDRRLKLMHQDHHPTTGR